jgi:hypothetical protein
MASTTIEHIDDGQFMASEFYDDGRCMQLAYGFGRTMSAAMADLEREIERLIEAANQPWVFPGVGDEIPF